MDKISVIVPIYNVQDYVDVCIESIRKQTYKNLEIILVDDGSTDSSGEICDKYARLDHRIRVIHKENGGLSAARNAALDICTGNYVGFVDGDDTIDEDMYELLYRNATSYNADISMCKEREIYNGEINLEYKEKNVRVYNGFSECIKEIYLGKGLCVSVCIKLFKRALFDKARFIQGKTMEDVYILCDLFGKNTKMAVQYISKYNYIQRDGSITHKKRYTSTMLDWVDSYEYNHEKIMLYSPELSDVSYYGLFWVYRETINRIMMTDDWMEHKLEIDDIHKRMKSKLLKCLTNAYMSKKQKIATILSIYSPSLYKRIKKR